MQVREEAGSTFELILPRERAGDVIQTMGLNKATYIARRPSTRSLGSLRGQLLASTLARGLPGILRSTSETMVDTVTASRDDKTRRIFGTLGRAPKSSANFTEAWRLVRSVQRAFGEQMTGPKLGTTRSLTAQSLIK